MSTVAVSAPVEPTARCERLIRGLVWGIWVAMLLFAVSCLVLYSKNIPLAEDWTLVAPLTGHEQNLLDWLWSQNAEHRVPLPRWILLNLLVFSNGDFRVGAIFNLVAVGTISFALMRTAAVLRGRTSIADVFFPLALLHVGNWQNLFWSWQLSFVVPVVVALGILCVALCDPTLSRSGSAIGAGLGLVLLPLCGAPGLIFTPFLALWIGLNGVLRWRATPREQADRWIGLYLLGSAALALVLLGLYFVGYVHPDQNPPSPSVRATLRTAGMFLANGLGPAARESWRAFTVLALVFLLPSAALSIVALGRRKGAERLRAAAVVLFFASLIAMAIGFGHGRAALVPTTGMPNRYVLLAAPAFCVAFLAWQLYGSAPTRSIAQLALLITMLFMLPLNTAIGLSWGTWYRVGMEAVERDLRAGESGQSLAQRHRFMLIHWWPEEQIANQMRMLRNAQMGPFTHLQDPIPPPPP